MEKVMIEVKGPDRKLHHAKIAGLTHQHIQEVCPATEARREWKYFLAGVGIFLGKGDDQLRETDSKHWLQVTGTKIAHTIM